VSREIGSDVAFFLSETDPARPALVGGLGDRIARLEPVRGYLVLIVPSFGCATGAVYKAYDSLGPRPLREGDVAHMAAAGRVEGGLLFNDLTAAAMSVQPALASLREQLRRLPVGPVCMSGSGSTLFIVCRDAHEAARVQRLTSEAAPEVGVLQVRLV
jgi:4-diphosphocytidyl-2-C-methyl-D-erythritol kinase